MVVAPRRERPSEADELPHGPGITDEWLFAAWSPDASVGLLSGHRVTGSRAWYWSAFVQSRQPLLHLAEWDVKVRADPFIVKAPEMWAEHHCVAPLEQWSIGNEAYFVALDDPDEAFGRAYGTPTPTAMDLEWYQTADPELLDDGFCQRGVVHGRIDVMGRDATDLVEVPAVRWRRWRTAGTLAAFAQPGVIAHTGLRAVFAFPDGSTADWVLTRQGWRTRGPAPR